MADSTVTVKVVPEIDEEALRDRLLEVIAGYAVVKPGETLVIRVRDLSTAAVGIYQRQLDRHLADAGLPFKVLAVTGDELAVAAAPACCVCGSPDVTYRNYRDQPFCAACADSGTPIPPA